MPFSNTQSLTATDVNNMRRGLHRDNTSYTVTGTTVETNLATLIITGGTISDTGRVIVEAAGTTAQPTLTKRIRLYFGGTVIFDSTALSGDGDWYIRAVISNTAANAQRITVMAVRHNSNTSIFFDYLTAAVDTNTSVLLRVTAELGNTAASVTQTKFEVEVQQIA